MTRLETLQNKIKNDAIEFDKTIVGNRFLVGRMSFDGGMGCYLCEVDGIVYVTFEKINSNDFKKEAAPTNFILQRKANDFILKNCFIKYKN